MKNTPLSTVLAFRDPGDGFHMQWMNGEKCGHERTRPGFAGHLAEQEKE